jgi:acetyltransferase-like isoleucine patch superfamily enzyme
MKKYIPLLRKQGMKFEGVPRYIGANVVFDDINLISLGDRVVISDECHFLTHDYSITTALIAINKAPEKDIALVRGIEIGNNVFIGKKTIVMPNTSVGNDVIVGAGTVLRGKIPNGSIVIGNPSEVIGNIYDQAEKWSKYLTSDLIRKD